MYSFTPDPDQKKLRQEILEAVASLPGVYNGGTSGFDRERWTRLGAVGIPGLAIPEVYGGKGCNALSTTIALEALGYAHPDNGFNFSVAAHLLACVVPLWLYGSEELKTRYLPGLCNGSLIAANAMSEPSSGSDAFSMKTTAQTSDAGYSITGSKTFVSNGPIADVVLLYAATDPTQGFMGGISAFWVDRQFHTYARSEPLEKAGLHHSQLGSLFFEEMHIESKYMVGSEGRGAHLFNRSMEWERTCLGGLHIGNMHRLIDRCVRHLRAGFQQGWSREAHQMATYDLAIIQTQLEAVRLQAYVAAWKIDLGKPAGRESAMAKLAVSDLYQRATLRIANIYNECGVQDLDADQSVLDALSSTLYSGTSEMQKTIIAQSMGL
ncbi:MAG: acyl-CoA dehydrogenase family protein [Saprospiraceae bacterium]|nr:acyl-CoA dehydrogenase family protein [Saprospiraceae bacterium]